MVAGSQIISRLYRNEGCKSYGEYDQAEIFIVMLRHDIVFQIAIN